MFGADDRGVGVAPVEHGLSVSVEVGRANFLTNVKTLRVDLQT